MSLPSATQRILIVDDDKDVAPLFRSVLENAGYSVSSTLSGKEGLRAIREEAFELVILDLSMPDVDGFEILKAIRNQASKPKILVVSGHADLLAAATKVGADLTLDKVVATDVLAIAVRKLI